MVETYLRLFGEKPRHTYLSPLEKNDHPEMDTSELLPLTQTKIFQSMIGACQWVIQLGRFDIAVHIMSLSSFRAKPRQGHLDRIKRIYGYLYRFRFATIRVRTGMPDFSDLNVVDCDWSNSPYAGTREDLPTNLPTPRGKPVKMYTYADANLYHDMLNGKAVITLGCGLPGNSPNYRENSRSSRV